MCTRSGARVCMRVRVHRCTCACSCGFLLGCPRPGLATFLFTSDAGNTSTGFSITVRPLCSPGTFSSSGTSLTGPCTGVCTAGYACPAGSNNGTASICPVGQYSLSGAGACSVCPLGRCVCTRARWARVCEACRLCAVILCGCVAVHGAAHVRALERGPVHTALLRSPSLSCACSKRESRYGATSTMGDPLCSGPCVATAGRVCVAGTTTANGTLVQVAYMSSTCVEPSVPTTSPQSAFLSPSTTPTSPHLFPILLAPQGQAWCSWVVLALSPSPPPTFSNQS